MTSREVLSKLEDLPTISKLDPESLDFVRKTVKRVSSEKVVEADVDLLASFTKLQYATNILVRVRYDDLATLEPIAHLRSLCIQVDDAPSYYTCMRRLIDLFYMQHKADDQYMVIRVVQANGVQGVACFRNRLFLDEQTDWHPDFFYHADIRWLLPRPLFALMQAAYHKVDQDFRRILDIMLLRRACPPDYIVYDLAVDIQERVGEAEFKELVERYMRDIITDSGQELSDEPEVDVADSMFHGITWDTLHHYDMPLTPPLLTVEEKNVLDGYVNPAK